MTRYVMNYVLLLVNYNISLNNLLEDFNTDKNAGADKKMTPSGRCVIMLITRLQEQI
jgi:exocyst complex component 7